ncbi:MAG TPA: anthranilate synthase family protein [Micromonosporaceae bacterium]|nr:anthranilate synthase family protein [Micromonosporaceae bacterium]
MIDITALRQRPFALLRREGRAEVEILVGVVEQVERLADIPLPTGVPAAPGPDVLALVPYRQVAERGFACIDDGTPLSCLRVESVDTIDVGALLATLRAVLPATPVTLAGGRFDVSDEEYGRIVGSVLADEIGRGEGANFVIHRVFEGDLAGDPVEAALGVFQRLLCDERGAYWTFLVHTGERTLVGATPERHVSVEDGLTMMNPISGTYRHPATGPDADGLLRFLAETKEADELYMVLDEELKMMATVADRGGQVVGPYLKPMAHLTHTEYLLAGRSSLDVREVLRQTMFAPTVVGSPIENACRVIARHERRGRGYYAGVLALLGRDAAGGQTLDAPILIRTVEISPTGRARVPVGATLVRDSTAAGEVAETHAKAAGVLAALGLRDAGHHPAAPGPAYTDDPRILAALTARNANLAPFWLHERAAADPASGRAGLSALVVDAEDTFTGMLAHQLRALGVTVTRCSYRDTPDPADFDLMVAGPGPGDPADLTDPKMAALRALTVARLDAGRPLLAICLGHQVLASVLGLPLLRKDSPYQGMQREIRFFGRPELVGFYSTFTAVCASDTFPSRYGPVQVSRDPRLGEVHALRGRGFAGVQFHPESVLTRDGVGLLADLLDHLTVRAVSGLPPIA